MWNGLVDESSGRGRRWNRERHCDYCCGIVEANRINPNSSQLKVATITTPPMAVDLLKFSCKSATSKHPIVRHRGRNLELIYDLRQPCLATADFGTAGHKEYPLEIHHIRAQLAIARQERWDQGAGVFGNDVVKVAMLQSSGSTELASRIWDFLPTGCGKCKVEVDVSVIF